MLPAVAVSRSEVLRISRSRVRRSDSDTIFFLGCSFRQSAVIFELGDASAREREKKWRLMQVKPHLCRKKVETSNKNGNGWALAC